MKDPRWRMRHLPGYLLGSAILFCLRLLPRRVGCAGGRLLGRVFFHLSGKHRRMALQNMERALGHDIAARDLRRLALAAFAHMGQLITDSAYFSRVLRMPTDRIAVYEGVEHLRDAAADGRGMLVFSGHFGHWELIALLQHRLGYPMAMVASSLSNPLFNRLLVDLREQCGNRVIPKRNAARPVLRTLRDGQAVAILIDQNVRGEGGIFIDFFGVPASTTPALATLSLKSGAPIVPVFSYPMPDGRLLIRYRKPIRPARSGTLPDDIHALTTVCTKLLEEEIRARPELWLWMHNRWRTRPPSDGTAAGNAPASVPD
jgi:KDO2-lipid IV(A) lauroyltransferase